MYLFILFIYKSEKSEDISLFAERSTAEIYGRAYDSQPYHWILGPSAPYISYIHYQMAKSCIHTYTRINAPIRTEPDRTGLDSSRNEVLIPVYPQERLYCMYSEDAKG